MCVHHYMSVFMCVGYVGICVFASIFGVFVCVLKIFWWLRLECNSRWNTKPSVPKITHLWDVEKIPSDHSEYVRSPIYSCNEFKCNLEHSCRMNTNSMNTIGEQYELEIKSLHNLGELVLCWRELLYQCLSFLSKCSGHELIGNVSNWVLTELQIYTQLERTRKT